LVQKTQEVISSYNPNIANTTITHNDLNFGALPVPVELVSSQSIGPSLGQTALAQSVMAGVWGFLLVALFLLVWYRLPGLIAVVFILFINHQSQTVITTVHPRINKAK
jgi:preprotein translocase subunit SecD